MITSFFLNLLFGFFSLILGFLPTGSLPAGFVSALNYFWSLMNSFSYLIPMDTILQAVLVVLFFDLVVLLWHFIHWILAKIPFLHVR